MNALQIKKSAKITQALLTKLAANMKEVFDIADTVNALVETDGGSALTEADLQTLLDAITEANLKLTDEGFALDNNDPAYLRDLADHNDALKAQELAEKLEEEEQRAAEEAARVAREAAAREKAARDAALAEAAAREKADDAAKNPAYLRLLELADVSDSEDEEPEEQSSDSEYDETEEPVKAPVVRQPLTLRVPKGEEGTKRVDDLIAKYSSNYNITIEFVV
jgi:hypothetical protein